MKKQPPGTPARRRWTLIDKHSLGRRLMAATYLSSTDKIIGLAFLARKNPVTGQCNPSVAVIAADVGMKRRVVPTSIARLKAAGFLQTTRRRGTTQYDFLRDWQNTPEAALAVARVLAGEKAMRTKRLPKDDLQRSADHPGDSGRDAYVCIPQMHTSASLDTHTSADLKIEKLKREKEKGISSLALPAADIPAREAIEPSSRGATRTSEKGSREEGALPFWPRSRCD